IVFAASPLMVISVSYAMRVHAAYEDSSNNVQQSVLNMRTIALNRKKTFKTKYKDSIAGPHRMVIRGALIIAIGFGAFQSLQSIGIL
ncbi:13317_t:CDS:2, partial [Ambispora leptoticha]